MWNATYADLINSHPERQKFYKGESFGIKDETITLAQSLININDIWHLEQPRNRTLKEKQQLPDRERYLLPIEVNTQIRQTTLDGNPYTLFKKGRTVNTEYALAYMPERYQESLGAIKEVDGRNAIIQVRPKRNGINKIELVDINLQQYGYMDLIDYIKQPPPANNSFEKLLHTLSIAKASFILLNSLHTQHNRTYGDFKPDNIMINPTTGEMCLVDYENSKQKKYIRAGQGTHLYSAPEIFLPKDQGKDGTYYVDRKVDNFAAGVMLSILVGIVEPWENRTSSIATYSGIVQHNPEALGDQQFYNEYMYALKPSIDILDRQFTPEELDRYMADFLYEMSSDYQFVDTNQDILRNIIYIIAYLTRFNPEDRISLDTAIFKLDETITALRQRYQAATATPEPHLSTPADAKTQNMEVDGTTTPLSSQLTGTAGR